MLNRTLRLSGSLVLFLAFAAPAWANNDASQFDWPHWRGPEFNGISREKGIVDKWTPQGENLLWKRDDLGTRSTPIVMNGKLYIICRDQPGTPLEGEKVVCIDAASGEDVWETRWNVYLSDVPDTRIGWSSVVGDPETGNVYAQGVNGYFACLNGETGETLWSHSIHEEYGLLSTYGGRTNFPVLFENLVLISAVHTGWGDMAKPAHRFIAFDKRNGQPLWYEGTRLLPDDTTYSSPIISVINGQAQMIFASGDGTFNAFQPRTGKKIWSYSASLRGINITPLVVGTTVYGAHSEENLDSTKMGALFALDATQTGDITKTGVLWRNVELLVGKSTPLVVDGRIYAPEDTGALIIADAATGKIVKELKLGGTMRSSPIYVDGKIFIITQNGRWWTFKPSEDGVETVHKARFTAGEFDASPIISRGRMYVASSTGLFCIGTQGQEPSSDPIPEPPAETAVADDPAPAALQISPVESLLKPGQKQQFQVRLFNKNGQLVKVPDVSEVSFAVEGPGEIGKDGKYNAPAPGAQQSGVIVTAKLGELSGRARIRVVPDLPWSFDFEDGQVPITWVGARYRHVPIDFDLYASLKEKDQLAAKLYIFLMTGFINNERPALKIDDSTPMLQWKSALEYLGLVNDAEVLRTVAGAQAKLDPSLKLLKEENVVADWSFTEWSADDQNGVQFSCSRGPRKIDGNGVIAKISTIPKGTRSQAWMGQVDNHDYTIQADVFSANRDGRLSDAGLIAQRYAMDLMGASQQISVRSWHAVLSRFSSITPLTWEADTWYTMKFRASVEDGKAVLRGKVWKRGDAEPEAWSFEATDEMPNLAGSPGLYGNAKDSEIFYDNLTVTPN